MEIEIEIKNGNRNRKMEIEKMEIEIEINFGNRNRGNRNRNHFFLNSKSIMPISGGDSVFTYGALQPVLVTQTIIFGMLT